MPASATWVHTPNKKDHLTAGFTTKVLYNYGYTGGIPVDNGYEVFKEIKTANINYKGTNYLPANYFVNIDDGRTFRITMYFKKEYDGYDINLVQQLYDVTNGVTYDFNLDFLGTFGTDYGNFGLVKYECYLSYFVDPSGPTSIMQATGTINYAEKYPGNAPRILQINTGNSLSYGPAPAYEIRILNVAGAIYPTSLLIEEIS